MHFSRHFMMLIWLGSFSELSWLTKTSKKLLPYEMSSQGLQYCSVGFMFYRWVINCTFRKVSFTLCVNLTSDIICVTWKFDVDLHPFYAINVQQTLVLMPDCLPKTRNTFRSSLFFLVVLLYAGYEGSSTLCSYSVINNHKRELHMTVYCIVVIVVWCIRW